jgi:hypothetical protein
MLQHSLLKRRPGSSEDGAAERARQSFALSHSAVSSQSPPHEMRGMARRQAQLAVSRFFCFACDSETKEAHRLSAHH